MTVATALVLISITAVAYVNAANGPITIIARSPFSQAARTDGTSSITQYQQRSTDMEQQMQTRDAELAETKDRISHMEASITQMASQIDSQAGDG